MLWGAKIMQTRQPLTPPEIDNLIRPIVSQFLAKGGISRRRHSFEDLMQEARIIVYHAISRVDPDRPLIPYLRRAVNNRLSKIRSRDLAQCRDIRCEISLASEEMFSSGDDDQCVVPVQTFANLVNEEMDIERLKAIVEKAVTGGSAFTVFIISGMTTQGAAKELRWSEPKRIKAVAIIAAVLTNWMEY